jgi:hypothetical protein
MPASPFALCSVCRKEIPLGGKVYKCTVSTCNRKRFPLYFCSPACWDAHLPEARHRDPAYIEEIARKS